MPHHSVSDCRSTQKHSETNRDLSWEKPSHPEQFWNEFNIVLGGLWFDSATTHVKWPHILFFLLLSHLNWFILLKHILELTEMLVPLSDFPVTDHEITRIRCSHEVVHSPRERIHFRSDVLFRHRHHCLGLWCVDVLVFEMLHRILFRFKMF